MGTHVSGDADAPPTVGEAQAKTYRGRSPRLASRVRPRPGPRGAGNTINPMRIYLVGGCAALGAWAGALAVWPTYRLAVPLGTAPRGDCPRCRVGLPAGWRGWLRLGGRCPACRTALVAHSWAWPVVAATGFATLAWRLPVRHQADVWLLGAWLLLTAVGLVLAGIDARVNRLPRPILVVTGGLIGVLVAAAGVAARNPEPALHAVITGAAFGGVYLVLALIGSGPVGPGDVYLAGLLGLLLGTGQLAAILAGAVLPYLLGAPITAARLLLGRVNRGDHVAWGPYLITGAVLAKVLFPL